LKPLGWRRRRGAFVALGVAAAVGLGSAQQKAQFTFRASAHLVVEAVEVQNHDGEPVANLTAKDFAVTENGVPQTVAFCRYQKLSDIAVPPPRATPPRAAAKAAAPVTAYQITPETPGSTKYNNRRLVALYFDMTAMPIADQLRALSAAQRFIATGMRAADLMAILDYAGNGVKVRQDFTGDQDKLQKAIGDLILGTGVGFDESAADAAAADTGTAFGQDDSEFNIFNTNRQLAALETAIEMLAPISEKKSLVYFASGLNLHGVDNQAQLEATTNAAIKANVALFPLDARGLVAEAPLGDASQGSPGGVSMYNGAAANAVHTRLIASQDTLYALGSDTGGKAILDTNNLAGGIATAANAIGSYYLIGYYTTNTAQDGKFRRIRIALRPPRAGVKLSYRVGYYADKVFAKFNHADRERQLEDALMLPNPITQLTIDLEVNYFELDSANYFVPLAAKIPGSELALAKKGGASETRIDFIGEVKDQYGTTITNLRDRVQVKLNGATAAQLARSPIEYTTGFTLLPGEYTVKLLARDNETGRIGTYIKTFTVPNLMRARGLPLSSVVLASQQEPLNAALFNAKKSAAADAASPLIEHNVELMPSVTRVFSRRQTLTVYLQAYEHGPAAAPLSPLEAYVTFYRNGARVVQTPLLNVHQGREGRAGAVPIAFHVPLARLAPGEYVCQVSVLDPAKTAVAFWRGKMMVVP
jgi:VWFA-related protein